MSTHQKHYATFTCYPIVEHTEASEESEVHVEGGAVEATIGGGRLKHSSALGGSLPAAGETITTIVEPGMYADVELGCDVKEHLQMHVRVGILKDLTGEGVGTTGKLQLLDVRKISGNKILVLRQPRLSRPTPFPAIDWPCGAEDICNAVSSLDDSVTDRFVIFSSPASCSSAVGLPPGSVKIPSFQRETVLSTRRTLLSGYNICQRSNRVFLSAIIFSGECTV